LFAAAQPYSWIQDLEFDFAERHEILKKLKFQQKQSPAVQMVHFLGSSMFPPKKIAFIFVVGGIPPPAVVLGTCIAGIATLRSFIKGDLLAKYSHAIQTNAGRSIREYSKNMCGWARREQLNRSTACSCLTQFHREQNSECVFPYFFF